MQTKNHTGRTSMKECYVTRKQKTRISLAFGLMFVAVVAAETQGQTIQDQTVQASGIVLNEALSSPLNRIPAAMLADCHGVAIVPNVIKGGFIVGVRHGKGLLFIRDAAGTWHAPVFITLTGGNIGWQAGVQSSDIVLVFKTPRSVEGILAGKLTIGGDASAAAGPVGRETAVATDGQLKAEIYTYSRSRGLFAGVSIDGSAIQIDPLATGAYYRSPGPDLPVTVPAAALALTQVIAGCAGNALAPPTSEPQQTQPNANSGRQVDLAQQYGSNEVDLVRNQLLQIAPRLFDLLDPQWSAYLALPFTPQNNGQPSVALVDEAISHYNAVANDARYQPLAGRPEFRSVHSLLQHYQHALTPGPANLQLPPPPGLPAPSVE